MPLYEYECEKCGVRFERRQSFSEEPVRICPECGGEVHRLIQPVGIVFKGSGFYVTDNRSSSPTAVPGKKSANSSTEKEANAKEPSTSETSTSDSE
jgi:putative FmdB family regulatory protein